MVGCGTAPQVDVEAECAGLDEVVKNYGGGQLKERYFLNCAGEKDSLYTSYFENGDIEYVGLYNHGHKDGVWKDYYYEGNKALPRIPNSYSEHVYRNDTLVSTYIHSSRQFDTTCTAGESWVIYDKNIRKRQLTYYYCSNQINSESFWVDDLPDSIHRTWNESGELYEIRHYKNYKPLKWIEYNPFDTTQLVKVSYFDEGKRSKTEHYKNNKVVRVEYPEE